MPRVKICGITNLEDALMVMEHGADALGFVFAPSLRQVNISTVTSIVNKLPPFISKVGVFVDSELSEVKETLKVCNLDYAQLHGNEGIDYCAALYPNVIKGFTISTMPSPQELNQYKAAAYLVDRDKANQCDEKQQHQVWQLARSIYHYGFVILAGGLTPDNVIEAIKTAQPYAVDVSSGVESEPGKKNEQKVCNFIKAAKHIKT